MTTSSPYGPHSRHLALFILFLAFSYNLLDRYLFIFLYSLPLDADLTPDEKNFQSIKEALGITSAEYGYLTGPAFMCAFSVFNLFSGYVGDNFSRKWTMLIGLLFCSVSVALMSLVNHFWHLFLLRSMLAASQAFFAPLGYALIGSYYDSMKVTANAIFASGVYVGYGLATLSLLITPHLGWRDTSLYTGIAGAGIAVLFLFIRDPIKAGSKSDAKKPSDQEDIEHQLVIQSPPTAPQPIEQYSWFQSLAIAFSSTHVLTILAILIPRLSGGGILGAFFPVLIKNRFPEQKSKFAAMNAVVVASGGILSSLFGGFVTDAWVKRVQARQKREELQEELLGDDIETINNIPLRSPAQSKPPSLKPYLFIASLSCLLSLGLFAGVFVSQNLYLSMSLLFVAYLFSECYFAPLLTMIHTTQQLPSNVRSTALSSILGCAQLVASFAPVVFGVVDEKYHDVQTELLIGVLIPNGIAGLIAFVAGCIVH